MPVKLNCATCEKEFYVDPYRVKANAKYCSKQCFFKKWESKYVFECRNCKKECISYGYTEGRKKYCSKPCMQEYRHSSLDRFIMERIERKENGCWNWTGSIQAISGYGKLFHEGKNYSAHRASYIAFKGKIPKGKYICHSCDNKSCVNPDHLWIGTQRENMQDMVKKGRKADQTGKRLSLETIEKIRKAKKENPTRYWFGKTRSEETKKKISETKKRQQTQVVDNK